MNYFLVSTNHLETRILFQDEEDFKAAMNYVAVVTSVTGVHVLAFVLMSNHVHFMVCCTREQAVLRRNNVDIKEVTTQFEALEKAIAYVQMNPVAARICLHPTGYRWGTGNVFFNDLSVRARQRLLKSCSRPPPG